MPGITRRSQRKVRSVGRGRLQLRIILVLAWFVGAAATSGAAEQTLWERETIGGDWGGVRTALKEKFGIDVTAGYIGETFGIMSGGLRRGATYEGRLDAQIDIDLEKLASWKGGKLHARGFQIHKGGTNAAEHVGSIADPSNIDAAPTTRLFTLWFEQEFAQFASVRVGQLAADDEFLVSATAGGLINGTFGWAAMTAANLPSGGPAYPLATPGVRLRLNPFENVFLLGAVFSGDPAGAGCTGNPQICNSHGTTFSLSGGAFWIAEAQYQVNQGKEATGLAAAYKIGAWHHTGGFADQRFGLDPALGLVSIAALPPDPLLHGKNHGVYGVIDQMLWRSGPRSLSVFARAGASPSDRNLVSWYVDGGLGLKGLLPGRDGDTLTVGVARSHIGRNARGLDLDTLLLNGPPYPLRSAEAVFELSYIAQIAPWWTIQPDLQYIVRPSGGVPDPQDAARTVGNAFLVGARTSITF